ncbi:MAPEG family protein [Thalassovita mangrovi]|uniref:Glutathione S-transferase n=1 Tax=Thalassovita mangrovi TaxID=2692236 RepID=A0A6L8LNJ3_9RHOB|nr:MAPEG family protein [Thalassovita mangrovi]MYM57607.1 hypothetical protein [Thalassovita mangrovi]
MLTITAIYASLLALLYVLLSFGVIRWRIKAQVSVGDGGDSRLARSIRCHSNFSEYVPIGIALLAISELQGAPAWVLHVLGLMLFGGRAMHAIGFGREPQIKPLRGLGFVLTMAMILLAALGNLGHALF